MRRVHYQCMRLKLSVTVRISEYDHSTLINKNMCHIAKHDFSCFSNCSLFQAQVNVESFVHLLSFFCDPHLRAMPAPVFPLCCLPIVGDFPWTHTFLWKQAPAKLSQQAGSIGILVFVKREVICFGVNWNQIKCTVFKNSLQTLRSQFAKARVSL